MIILLSAADILQVCAEAGTIRKGETPLAGRKYGLDLGTMNIRIFQGGHGLVVYEKNMIAIQRKKEVAAIGNDAFEMYAPNLLATIEETNKNMKVLLEQNLLLQEKVLSLEKKISNLEQNHNAAMKR